MSDIAADVLADGIRRSLRMVIDPELGENIVDLGLIYDVSVSANGAADILMTMTMPGCPASAYLSDAAQAAAGIVEGIHHVEVQVTYEPRWTPEMMNDEARRRLGPTGTGAAG